MNYKVIALLSLWLVTYLIGTFFVWLPLFLIGVPLVALNAYVLKRWVHSGDRGWQGPAWWWKDKYMNMWQTSDNGCAPLWYVNGYGSNRSLATNMFVWSAFRNAVGGNPMHSKLVPNERVRVWGSDWPSKDSWDYFKKTGKRKWMWRMIQSGWRVGIWGSKYIGNGDDYRVIDIQHGFKRQYYLNNKATGFTKLNFSPWDSGRRTR